MKSEAVLTFVGLLALSPSVYASPPFVVQPSGDGGAPALARPPIDGFTGHGQGDSRPVMSAEEHQSISSQARDSWWSWLSSIVRRPSHLDLLGDDASSVGRGDHDHGIIDFSDLTITEILQAALGNHHDHDYDDEQPSKRSKFGWHHDKPTPEKAPIHRLAWFVNQSAEAQKNLEADGITLLAPDDWALTPPHRRHPPRFLGKLKGSKLEKARQRFDDDNAVAEQMQPMRHPFMRPPRQMFEEDESNENDSDDKDERKERFAKLIAFFLRYHTLAGARRPTELVDDATFATTLREGKDSSESLRVRIEPSFGGIAFPHPSIRFNFYSTARGPVLKAKNGYIIFVSAPLFPPLTPINTAFLFPWAFSTLTSDVQKVGLADELLPSLREPELGPSGDSLIDDLFAELVKETPGRWTVFAPTNFAFARLGPKINAFLRSPFPLSRRILKYVLAYHLVPDVSFYSDYIGKDGDKYIVGQEVDAELGPLHAHAIHVHHPLWPPHLPGSGKDEHRRHPEPPHHPPHHPISHANITHYEFPTLLSTAKEGNPNATLRVDVVSYRLLGRGPIERKIIVLPARESDPHHHHPDAQEDEQAEHGARVWHDKRGDTKADRKAAKRAKKQAKKAKSKRCTRPVREDDYTVLVRSMAGPPHHPPHHGGPVQGPVKVIARDAVARFGAIQVLPQVLRPPMPHYEHHDDGHHRLSKRHLRALFA